MNFFKFRQNSTIYTDLAVIQHIQCQSQPFVSYLITGDPGPTIPNIVAILPDFDGFLPILSKLNYLYRCNRHPTLQYQNLPFVSHLLAEDQVEADPSAVKILPVFDVFLPIQSKLDYLYRFNRYPTPTMPKLTLCLPLARWESSNANSQCCGNIANFRWISSNFIKTQLSIQM